MDHKCLSSGFKSSKINKRGRSLVPPSILDLSNNWLFSRDDLQYRERERAGGGGGEQELKRKLNSLLCKEKVDNSNSSSSSS